MDRFQYLGTLKYYIRELPNKEQEAIIMDYRDYFIEGEAEGLNDEEISEKLGDPEVIANEILNNRPHTENKNGFNESVKKNTKEFIEGFKGFVNDSINTVSETANKKTEDKNTTVVPNQFTIEEEYSNIDIKSNSVKTNIKYSEDNITYVDIDGEYDSSKISYNLDNDTLTMKLNLSFRRNNNYIDVDLKSVTIYVPKKEYNHIIMKSNLSTMRCHELHAKQVELVHSMGELKVENIITEDLRCKNSVGNLRIQQAYTKQLNFKLSTGQLKIEQMNSDVDIFGKVATGDAKISLSSPIENARFSLKTSMGTINASGYKHGDVIGEGKHEININVSLGNAELLFQ